MKSPRRYLVLLAGIVSVFALAVAVVLAQTSIGSYTPQTLGKVAQPAPPKLSADSVYRASSYPAFAVDLAQGEGRGEVQIYCSTCHTPRYILMQPPLPAAAWNAEVHKMIKTLGAQIPESDAQKIVRYLQSHYTPETRK